jgi:hypothetical protein
VIRCVAFPRGARGDVYREGGIRVKGASVKNIRGNTRLQSIVYVIKSASSNRLLTLDSNICEASDSQRRAGN